MFRFEELGADIVELDSVGKKEYVMDLVEISSPEKVPKQAEDRISRELISGDTVSVSIKPKLIDDLTGWGVDIKITPVNSH
jgi:hypothetical protein